jgi:hypothetical protein
MNNNEITFKVTLSLNEKWAGNQSEDELVGYLKERLNSSLGFRGEIKKFKLDSKQK